MAVAQTRLVAVFVSAAMLLPFKHVAQISLGMAAALFIWQPAWRLVSLAVVVTISVLSRLHKVWLAGQPQAGDDPGLSLLLVGCGNVGAGIGRAFARAGWRVVVVDPSASLVPSELRAPPHAYLQMCIEEVPDDTWAWAAACEEIVYAADCGNRDEYAADTTLGETQSRRFTAFAHRLANTNNRSFRLRSVGGSWTRLEATATAPPLVDDLCMAKAAASSNPYERSKTEACERARALASSLSLRITHCDWASVVPNMAPNFSIAKMSEEALTHGRISYSGGDFGRPLCHADDAGRALLLLCQHQRLHDQQEGHEPSASSFEVLLVPGVFTPFARFAEAVADEVASRPGYERPTLVDKADVPPEALRARCKSQRLEALGFWPDAAMVEQGLRDACAARMDRE